MTSGPWRTACGPRSNAQKHPLLLLSHTENPFRTSMSHVAHLASKPPTTHTFTWYVRSRRTAHTTARECKTGSHVQHLKLSNVCQYVNARKKCSWCKHQVLEAWIERTGNIRRDAQISGFSQSWLFSFFWEPCVCRGVKSCRMESVALLFFCADDKDVFLACTKYQATFLASEKLPKPKLFPSTFWELFAWKT